MNYKIHPLAELFPSLSLDEFEKLKADIRKNGQLEPIIVVGDEPNRTVVDGRHRLKACKELGIEPRLLHFSRLVMEKTASWTLQIKNEGISDFIWSRNMLRRHLTDDQRAAIALRWSDAEKEAAKERQREHSGTAPGHPKNTSGESAQSVRTRTVIAAKAGVSEHKVRQAEVVASKAPELVEQVARGEIKLKDAVAQTNVQTINLVGDAFNEQAVLVRLYNDWEKGVEKNWPKNRDLAPVIRKVNAFATYLEGLQKVRAAELQKRVEAIR